MARSLKRITLGAPWNIGVGLVGGMVLWSPSVCKLNGYLVESLGDVPVVEDAIVIPIKGLYNKVVVDGLTTPLAR